MFVTAGHHDEEVRLTLDATVALANLLDDAGAETASQTAVRQLLVDHGFTRAPDAPAAAVRRVRDRIGGLGPRLRSLPDQDVDRAVGWVNDELRHLPIAPLLIAHHGAPLHIHWTRAAAAFDDQVVADVLMAIAQELVDHGTDRFGVCAAGDCEHLFYDATRNRSRRFCADPRCASRTHTAQHRARQRRA